MSSTRRTPTTPPRVSFGVELEFLVAFVYEGESDPDAEIKDELQPLVVVPVDKNPPASATPAPSGSNCHALSHVDSTTFVFDQIRNALAKAGLPVFGHKENIVEGSVQASHSRNLMSAFHITDDFSIDEFRIDGYRFQRVEMNSPAMYSMDLSFDMIRLAVSVLTTQFRCRVNPTCGFHVHVGAGPTERIDARTLRSFAALLWAADPLISRLHPHWRAAHIWSQSGRVNAATSLGMNRGPADDLLEMTGGGEPGWLRRSTGQAAVPISEDELKEIKYFSRDRQLGESVKPDSDPAAIRREMGMDTVDDIAILKAEPWTHRSAVPPVRETRGADELGEDDRFDFPTLDYTPPMPRPKGYAEHCASRLNGSAPSRPRPPPIKRRYPQIPGTMRQDRREDDDFLAPYLARHRPDANQGLIYTPGPRQPPRRSDVMSGVRDLLGADMSAAQVGEMMRNPGLGMAKRINYNFDGYGVECQKGAMRSIAEERNPGSGPPGLGSSSSQWASTKGNTVEFREAAGSLDGEWIAAWARICCRLLEWSRDAAPAEYMGVIRLLAWAQEEEGGRYDVVDFLIDLGLVAEARVCEERIRKGDAAWWECMNVVPGERPAPGCPDEFEVLQEFRHPFDREVEMTDAPPLEIWIDEEKKEEEEKKKKEEEEKKKEEERKKKREDTNDEETDDDESDDGELAALGALVENGEIW